MRHFSQLLSYPWLDIDFQIFIRYSRDSSLMKISETESTRKAETSSFCNMHPARDAVDTFYLKICSIQRFYQINNKYHHILIIWKKWVVFLTFRIFQIFLFILCSSGDLLWNIQILAVMLAVQHRILCYKHIIEGEINAAPIGCKHWMMGNLLCRHFLIICWLLMLMAVYLFISTIDILFKFY